MNRIIKFPLSKLSLKRLEEFRNDLPIVDRVALYNENILAERKTQRNNKLKRKRQEKKDAIKSNVRKRNLEYFREHFRKKEETNIKKKLGNVLKELKTKFTEIKEFFILLEIKTKTVYNQSQEDVYNHQGKIYDNEFVTQRAIKAKSVEDLNEQLATMLNKLYPIEDSEVTTYLKSYSYHINEEITHRINIKDVPMRTAFPYTASFLKHMNKVNPISLQDGHGECVINAVREHCKVKGKPMNKENLIKEFSEASLKYYNQEYSEKRGVTARMILHLCQKKNISCLGFDQSNNLFVKHTRDENKGRNYKSIIFYMFMNHFYLINDEETVRHITQSYKNNSVYQTSMQLEVEENQKDEEEINIYENLSIEEALTLPKNSMVIYNKPNVNDEFISYIELTRDAKPHLKYGNLSSIHSFKMPNNVTICISGCYGDGLDWQEIRNICIDNKMKFTNQSIGNLLLELKAKYYKKERVMFTEQERNQVLNSCNNMCKSCSKVLDKSFHIDHIRSLANGGDNSMNNLQSLCSTCHRDKSRMENENGEYAQVDDALSVFNIQNTKLINSTFCRKVAFTEMLSAADNDENIYGVDINKCRRNALIHSDYNFCVFSVLDNIEPFSGEVVDGIYYVECENKFPLRGNMFYTRPIVEYALSKGFITKENIKYQILPSLTLKKDYFKDFVAHLLDIFKNSPRLQKLSINSLVGLFGRRKNVFIKHEICNNDIDDIASVYEKFEHPVINHITDDIRSVTGEVTINKIETYFPIHMHVLDIEAIELHKMTCYITEQGGIPRVLKTDCVIYNAYDEIDFSGFYWDKEKTLPKYKSEGDDFCYTLQRPIEILNTDKLEIEFPQYNKYNENGDVINNIINSKNGCLILGPAGTGKTYLINDLVNKLGDSKILRLAPTNVSALLIGGTTLDKFTYNFIKIQNKQGYYSGLEYIIVDEISMVRSLFMQVLLLLKYYNPHIKFIVSGDFYQLPPVNDKVTKSTEHSRALYELVDGNILNLTVCRRSENTLFNLCETVKINGNIDTNIFGKKTTYLNLSFTNKKRILVNNECVDRFVEETGKPYITIPKLHYDDNSQQYKLCEGMPLIARINLKSMSIFNNEVYTVKKLKGDSIIVRNDMNEIEVKINDIPRTFNVAFCITVHRSQGQTFNKPYTIYEWKKMDSTLRYVSLSRATDINYINII